MAKFKYLGKDNAFVGRFGRLKTGAVVDLWQSETDYVLSRENPDWQLIETDDDLTGVGIIVPVNTPFYDLTRVFWLKETMSSLRRMSRPELLQVCRALRHINAKVLDDAQCNCLSREALMEQVHEEVRRLKWDQPGFGPIDRNHIEPKDVILKPEKAEGGEPEGTDEGGEAKEPEGSDSEKTEAPPIPVVEKPAKKEAKPKAKAEKPASYRKLQRER